MGAGVSGQLALVALPPAAPSSSASPPFSQATLQDLAVGPGVAPWAAGRVGLIGSNEAGLTYSGRTVRLDARHAFAFGKMALSVGLGGSAVIAERPGGCAICGAGADVPVLFGVRSSSDIYSLWLGPRVGFEILSGNFALPDVLASNVHVTHFFGGLTVGARVGFRHIHLALELNASFHHADGTYGSISMMNSGAPSTNVQQVSLTPAGALEITF